MADFAPPPGPPPPKVPEGYKAVWNDQYKEWFYVNIYTKQSTWEKPTEPVYPPSADADAPPPDAPPGYDPSTKPGFKPDDKSAMNSNNPYSSNANAAGSSSNMSEDEKLARQLQAEEQSKARGAADGYYGSAPNVPQYGTQSPQYGQGQLPPRDDGGSKKGGLFGKLASKLGGGSSSRPSYGQQGYGGGGYPQQQYGGYPPQQQYGGYPPQGYGGGYPQQYPPQRRPGGGGMGMAGGMALGAGAGLLGGALLAESFDDHEQDAYQHGYQDGQMDDGGDMGGDMGGDF